MNTHHDGAADMTTNNDAIAPNSSKNLHARRSLLPRLAGLTLALAIALPVAAQAPAFDANRFGPAAPLSGLQGDRAQPAPVLRPVIAAEPEFELEPGDYLWNPEASPAGPLVVVVSLPEQRAHVYRNGVRIAVSTISSGKPGHETPTGVFPILQKREEHYSNLYNNAPMPFMQRLTWDGIALHAGRIPGQPASHGCVRLPLDFARKLFSITEHGSTVVVADAASHGPSVAYPGDSAPVDAVTGLPLDRMDNIAVEGGSTEMTASLE